MKLKFFAVAMPLALMLTACDKQEEKFAGFTAVGTDKKAAKFYLDTNTVKRDRNGWVSFNMVRDLTDSYVIQNANANCESRFVAEEGVKYRQDGTSQEKFASETVTLPTDNADVTALVKMACDKAEENRMITGAFDDGKALEILFGNYDANTKTASWEKIDPPSSLEDYDKFSGKTGTVKILESKEFTQDGNTKHIVLTSTSVSYAADVLFSSAVFVKKGDKWQIEKEHSYLIITDKNVTASRIGALSEYPDLILKNENGENHQYRFNDGLYAPYKMWMNQEFEFLGNKFRVEFDSITPVYKDDKTGELRLSDCHPCQAEIGATTYKKINDDWVSISRQNKIGHAGAFGFYDIEKPEVVLHLTKGEYHFEKLDILNLTANKLIFLINDYGIHQGVEQDYQHLFLFSKNQWSDLGTVDTGYDDTSYYGEDTDKSCSYKGRVSVISSSKEYPDLLVTKNGKELDENYNPIPVKNSLYVFNGKAYEEKKDVKVPAVKNETVAAVQDTSAAKSSVMQMIDYAVENGGVGHESEIQEAKSKIESSPKPKKGNKKSARKINDEGHALLNKQDIDGAVAKFSEAHRLDPSDVEIANNLGFAYLKQKNLELAQQTLIATLSLAPARSAAWSNLGDVFALSGDERKAVACYANTYRFSKDMTKTHQFMKKMNAAEDVPALKQARDGAMSWAQRVYPELE